MAMDAGDNTVGAGTMAKAIYDEMISELGTPSGDVQTTWKKIAASIANGVVDHLAANADVRITTGDSALQRDDASSNDTLAPSSDKILAGALE